VTSPLHAHLALGVVDYLTSRLPAVDRVGDVVRGQALVEAAYHYSDGIEGHCLRFSRAESFHFLRGSKQIEVAAHRSQLQRQNLGSGDLVGRLELDYLVESSPDRGVQQLGVIRGGYEERVASVVIHDLQHRSDRPTQLAVIGPIASFPPEHVELIENQDPRSHSWMPVPISSVAIATRLILPTG